MNDVGRNIKNLRKKMGISQETLAEKLYVTRQAISSSVFRSGCVRPVSHCETACRVTYSFSARVS